MDIIDLELDETLNDAITKVDHSVEMTIHTVIDDYFIRRPLELAVHSDFHGNVGDIIDIECHYPLGDFIYDILPFRDNLEITIKHSYLEETDSNRYKFILLDIDSLTNDRLTKMDRTTLNNMDVFTLKGQCVDRVLEVLITQTVPGGIFKESEPLKVVVSNIRSVLDRITIADNEKIDEVVVDKPQNTFKYEHIVVKPGLRVLKLPSIMQDNSYGIYNGDIGTYVQKLKGVRTLKIYQLHSYVENLDRKHLYLVSTDTEHLNMSDRTFSFKNDILRILMDSTSNIIDPGAMSAKNKGLGYTGVDTGRVIADSVKAEEGDVTIEENSYRVNSTIESTDGTDNRIDVGLLHNSYAARSMINRNNGGYLQVPWENSDRFLLEPGMLVKYLRRVNGEVVENTGILHGVFTQYDFLNKTSRSILNIFIKY